MRADACHTGRKRVLLIGLGPTAESALESLTRRLTVVAIVRDEPGVDVDPVCARARQMGIRVISSTTMSSIAAAIDELRPDCVVVSSFYRMIPESLLSRCPFVNVHYALLPKYRGRASVNWAVINNESTTGITIHLISPGLDAGNILYQGVELIDADDTATDIYCRLNGRQRTELVGAVERLLAGDRGLPQDPSQATYGCTRVPDDGEIDWARSSRDVHNLIRALTPPFPGAFTYLDGKRLTIWRAKPHADPFNYVGRVFGRVVRRSATEGFIDVLTGDGTLRVFELQSESGERTAAANVIRSTKATLGLRTRDLLHRMAALEEACRRFGGDRWASNICANGRRVAADEAAGGIVSECCQEQR